jgi:hypothetical protein
MATTPRPGAENHLATFADLVSTVTAFADPPWQPAPRAGAPGTPPPELGRLHSRPRSMMRGWLLAPSTRHGTELPTSGG